MGRRRVFVVSLMWCGAVALTGCTGGADSAPSAVPTPAGSVTDEVTCTAFGDVLTIVGNVDVARREGRMEEPEQQGWYGLATRVLDRIPTRGEGAVSDAIGALQELAPATAQGVVGTPGFGTAEWIRGTQALASACADAGAETTVEGFTGG